MFKVKDEAATNAEISSTVNGKKFGHSFREEIKMDKNIELAPSKTTLTK